MGDPIPYKVDNSGALLDAPAGAIPINLFGAESGGGSSDTLSSPDGSTTAQSGNDGIFAVTASSEGGTGIFRVLDVGGVYSALLTDSEGNPLDSSWSPAGIVTQADLNMRVPLPPASGNFTLQSASGSVSWVASV